uniref:Putative Biotin--(Acetyl-CoA-carboxylase) ligase n=1 Tax=mine drainage metagenome TaxID=410659 RepID=E6PWK8_9ZZZZ
MSKPDPAASSRAARPAPQATPACASADAGEALALQTLLGAQQQACAVHWCEQIGSTNAELLARVRGAEPLKKHAGPPQVFLPPSGGLTRNDRFGDANPQLLVAGHQTAGRGRQGRPWVDGAHTSLLASLAWPFAPGTPIAGLSVAVGVWLAQCLRGLGAAEVRLKWPNDVLLQERKLAGVLVELADTQLARWAVIGIGLNLRSPPDLPDAIGLDACHLHQSAPNSPPADSPQGGQENLGAARRFLVSRWDVLRRLMPAMLAGLPIYAQAGFAPWTDAWNQLHAWTGEPVVVLDHGTLRQTGQALGVDDSGHLLLQTADGVRRVASGDVSLRRAAVQAGHRPMP